MTSFTQTGLPQINLQFQILLDRLSELGTGRVNVFDSNNTLVASVPATDESISIKENK